LILGREKRKKTGENREIVNEEYDLGKILTSAKRRKLTIIVVLNGKDL